MYQFNFQPVFENLDLLLYGALLTVRLSLAAMVLGLAVSVMGAVGKTSGIRPLRWLIDVYVEVIRNTPFLVQIFFIFFGLPAIGISMSPNTAALVALVIIGGIRRIGEGPSEVQKHIIAREILGAGLR